jgi:hypothetical protein
LYVFFPAIAIKFSGHFRDKFVTGTGRKAVFILWNNMPDPKKIVVRSCNSTFSLKNRPDLPPDRLPIKSGVSVTRQPLFLINCLARGA